MSVNNKLPIVQTVVQAADALPEEVENLPNRRHARRPTGAASYARQLAGRGRERPRRIWGVIR